MATLTSFQADNLLLNSVSTRQKFVDKPTWENMRVRPDASQHSEKGFMGLTLPVKQHEAVDFRMSVSHPLNVE